MIWANLLWQERRSDSQLVESVWASSTPVTISRSVIADPCTSIAFVSDAAGTRVVLSGPRTKPHSTLLEAGYTCTSIRLKPGVSLKNLAPGQLVNASLTIPADSGSRFRFAGVRLQFPGFEHAESLVDRLREAGCLTYKPLSPARIRHFSPRTHSRQIYRATGLSPYQLYQLQRIHQALRMLKQGIPAAEVASELAFTDQSHLIRAAKHFCGHTPRQLSQLPQTP